MTARVTLLVALDAQHLSEFRLVYPTWQKYKPDLLQLPLLVMAAEEVAGEVLELAGDLLHPAVTVIPVPPAPGATQRHRMLSSFVWAADHINTEFYLKLDTDVVATQPGPAFEANWLEHPAKPVFWASPWGYTKPATLLDDLVAWSRGKIAMPDFSSLLGTSRDQRRGTTVACHPRIISWAMLARTDWTRHMAILGEVGKLLPIPSQDTYLWAMAQARGDYYCRAPMRQFGLHHQGGSLRRLKDTCAKIMAA